MSDAALRTQQVETKEVEIMKALLRWSRVTSLAALAALAACATAAEKPASVAKPQTETPPPAQAKLPPSPVLKFDSSLVPRQAFFGNPDRASLEISPDGKQLAFLAPVDDVLNVWVAPAGDIAKARAVTEDRKRGIHYYSWAHDGKHLLYIQDKDGDENWHVYATDVKKGETRDLTPIEGVTARVVKVSHKKKNEIVVALNDRDKRMHDLWLIDLKTGERKLLETNDQGYLGYDVDDKHKAVLAYRMLPTGALEILKKVNKAWGPFLQIAPEDMLQTNGVGLDRKGKKLYLLDSTGRNTAALFEVDIKTGTRKLLAEDAQADLDRVMIHPTRKTVEAVAATYERRSWQFLDKKIGKHFAELAKLGDGDIEVTSRSTKDRFWTVARLVDDGPVRYYLYDTRKRSAQFVFASRKSLESLELAKMHPRVIAARDGLKLVSYLSLPPASDVDGDGVPAEPLPMVLLVHGGPWARDSWRYHPLHQWLASRGYAVLSVNFRGSMGFGKAFTNAADGQWSGTMHNDLLDAVAWAVEAKVAQPDKVAIMGGSYGGYATLVGLTFTPEAFTCGVDIVGPSNLVTLLENFPPYWMPMLPMLTTRVGDPTSPAGKAKLEAASPLFKAKEIVRPLLIGQGANDPRVTQQESDQLVKAMQERGIPVTYLLYPDEGHGFRRPPNKMSFFAVSELFLAQCLGGSAQPLGDDLKGSTLQVPAGIDQVHGLDAALQASSAPADSAPESQPAP